MGGRARFSSSRGGGGRGRGGNGGRQHSRHPNRDNRDAKTAATATTNFRAPGYMDGTAKSVDERVVGIREFLSPTVQGFHGTVKERYSDFLVREVARNGAVAQLTDVKRFTSAARSKNRVLKVSEVFKQRVFAFLNDAVKRTDASEKDTADQKMVIPPPVHALVGRLAGRLLGLFNRHKRMQAATLQRANVAKLTTAITAICDESTARDLESFILRLVDEHVTQTAATQALRLEQKAGVELQSLAKSKEPEPAFVFPEIEAKESRAAVHAHLRTFADTLVVSDTVAGGRIRVRRATVDGKKRNDVDQRRQQATAWPSDRPDFLQFVLYKRNLETNSVMAQLAKAMGVNVSAFSYAGTKDKRGITTQFCTLYRGSQERLEMLNRAGRDLESFNFLVGDATYMRDRLHLGDLSGNQFSLAIRRLPAADAVSDAQVHAAVTNWATRGFVNYFGLQRFGTKSIPTHDVGRAILTRDYALAVDLVLRPQDGDATAIAAARTQFQIDRDVDAALRALPPYLIAERAVLQGLKTHGIDAYAQAIQCVPRHLRMVRACFVPSCVD